jgi:hypothetical protein
MTHVLHVFHERREFIRTHQLPATGEFVEQRLDIRALFHQLDEVLEGREIEISACL